MKMKYSRNYPYCLLILLLSALLLGVWTIQGLAAVSSGKATTTKTKSQKVASGQTVKKSAKDATVQKSVKGTGVKGASASQATVQAKSKVAKAVPSKKGAASSKVVSRKSGKKLVVVTGGKKKGKGARTAKVRSYAPLAARSVSSADGRNLHLNVKSALLINMSTGTIYYEQDPDEPIPPASITKVLTLYLIRDAIARGEVAPSTPIPVSAAAVNTGGSRMRLKRGERVPLVDLMKGISIVSANNACVAVAEYLGKGDATRFVAQMNTAAKRFGMTQSRFKNPNGLPAPGQLSTARDIAKLSMNYLRNFPESLAIHSMTTHTFNGATHRNANSLLSTYPGVDGLKTGFVCASGYNITATAKRGNTRLVAVVLGAQNSVIRAVETARLLNYGFERAAMEHGIATSPEDKPKS